MDPAAFRAAAHAVADLMADDLEGIEGRAVFPAIEPGSLRPLFPASAPEGPETIEAILADYGRLIEPNATHWQHPSFLAYFPTIASGSEYSARGSPGSTRTPCCGARPRSAPSSRSRRRLAARGARPAGAPSTGCSPTRRRSRSSSRSPPPARPPATPRTPASGPDRAAARLRHDGVAFVHRPRGHDPGLGRAGVRRVPVDATTDASRALRRRSPRTARRAGCPIAVVATLGTTSSTAIDPVASIADVCRARGPLAPRRRRVRRRHRAHPGDRATTSAAGSAPTRSS